MSIFLIAAAGIAVLLYLIQPFLEESPDAVPVFIGSNREKNAILDEIEDIDLEHAAGKIPDAAYAHIRAELTAKAAHIIAAETAAETETLEPAGAFCSRCGNAVAPDDLYCASCGEKISTPNRATER